MPITCKGGQKVRFRVKTVNGKKIRLAFCGNKVVETKKLPKKGKKK